MQQRRMKSPVRDICRVNRRTRHVVCLWFAYADGHEDWMRKGGYADIAKAREVEKSYRAIGWFTRIVTEFLPVK